MTGLELLQKILEKVESIEKRLEEVEKHVVLSSSTVKALHNRAGALLAGNSVSNKPEPTRNGPSVRLPVPQQQPQSIDSFESQAPKQSAVLTYKRVHGTLKDARGRAIDGVLVMVYDRNNEVCATTTSDPTGFWETMLRPGRYSAEFKKDGMQSANKMFELTENMGEYELK